MPYGRENGLSAEVVSRTPGWTNAIARASPGFTVIELMMVVAMLGILVSLGAPGFRELITSQRVKNASFDVFSTLVLARSEAIARNMAVRICLNGGGSWADGWTVTADSSCDSLTPVNTIRAQGTYSSITITGPNGLSFSNLGRLNNPTSAISVTAANMRDADSRCIVIDSSGRPVSKRGTCS